MTAVRIDPKRVVGCVMSSPYAFAVLYDGEVELCNDGIPVRQPPIPVKLADGRTVVGLTLAHMPAGVVCMGALEFEQLLASTHKTL